VSNCQENASIPKGGHGLIPYAHQGPSCRNTLAAAIDSGILSAFII
jgi:hypothetical protein